MKIIIIDHYAGNPKMGMEYRPFYLAKEWQKMGHNVRIIASSFSHLRYINPVLKDSILKDSIEDIEFYWVKSPKYNGNGIQRVYNIMIFLIRVLFNHHKLINSYNPDIIISSSTYPLDGVLVKLITRNKKLIHIHEIHDLWPLTLKLLGGYGSYNPFIALLQWAENYVIKNCDFLVSILPGTFSYLNQHGLPESKFAYIPNGFAHSKRMVNIPKEHEVLLNSLRKQGKFVLLYAGGHNISNALNYLVLAAEKLSDPDVAIIFVGSGTEKESLIKMATNKNLENTYFLPSVPKDSVPSLLKQADSLFLGWSKSPLYDFGISPNKIFDYMLASKPIIHSYSGRYDIVRSANCGISVQAENYEEIAIAILKMKKMSSNELSIMGLRGYKYVTNKHDYRILAENFINLIKT